MKSNPSIWLNEYEGLLPVRIVDREPSDDGHEPVHPVYDAVKPHFELTPVNLERATSIAFFE